MIPHLLLVEDDEVSRTFLAAALESLPACVDIATDIAGALQLAASRRHALWLIDAHLPDGDGVLALSRLRTDHAGVDALAVTAEDDRDVLDALCDAGYLEVLQKPISIAALLAAVRRALGEVPSAPLRVAEKLPVWDQAQALRAVGGRHEALEKLRGLFLDELPRQRELIATALSSGDVAALQSILHKLKASAGFVGAARLLQSVHACSDAPLDQRRHRAFQAAAEDQLTATEPDPDPDHLPPWNPAA